MGRSFVGGEALGDDEIFGDDDDEIFGDDDFGDDAPGEAALAKKVRAARQAGGKYVANVEPRLARRQSLPFSQAFTASQNLVLQLEPQRKFRTERLSFASLTAIYFTVSDVSIAQEPQFVAPGVTLCQLLSEVSQGMDLRGKTANLGAIISINATNIDAVASRTIYALTIGSVVM
jgi:hypothetical protein